MGLDIQNDGTVVRELAHAASGDGVLAKVDLGLNKFGRLDNLLLSTLFSSIVGFGCGGPSLAGGIGVRWNLVSFIGIMASSCIGSSSPEVLGSLSGSGGGGGLSVTIDV